MKVLFFMQKVVNMKVRFSTFITSDIEKVD